MNCDGTRIGDNSLIRDISFYENWCMRYKGSIDIMAISDVWLIDACLCRLLYLGIFIDKRKQDQYQINNTQVLATMNKMLRHVRHSPILILFPFIYDNPRIEQPTKTRINQPNICECHNVNGAFIPSAPFCMKIFIPAYGSITYTGPITMHL